MAKQNEPFQGFPKELPDYLWGLALNNEKPWFEAHRAEYERCLYQPMKALARQVLEQVEERCPGKAPALHISRIYRDARRLHGRPPFNDHLWFSLGQTAQVESVLPQFFFGIEARRWSCGVGLWVAKAEILERWRQRIDEQPDKLAKIVRGVNRMEGFERYGEVYKRPKGDPGPLLYDWYNARQLGVEKTVWFEPDPPGEELCAQLVEDYVDLMPLYDYLSGL